MNWKAWPQSPPLLVGTPPVVRSSLSSHGKEESAWDLLWPMKVKPLSHVWLFATPWTIAYQASPSMGFSKQEYRSGLPFPSPGDLPNPGIEPRSPALQADALPSRPPSKMQQNFVWLSRQGLRGPYSFRICSLGIWLPWTEAWGILPKRTQSISADSLSEHWSVHEAISEQPKPQTAKGSLGEASRCSNSRTIGKEMILHLRHSFWGCFVLRNRLLINMCSKTHAKMIPGALFIKKPELETIPQDENRGTFLVFQWLRHWAPNAGGPGSIPGQGTRSHMPQLKITYATTKTRHSQINKYITK